MDMSLHELEYNQIKKEHGVTNAVSHILRTPITCILGFSHLLESTTLTTEQRKYARNIEKSTYQLLSALNCVVREIKQCK